MSDDPKLKLSPRRAAAIRRPGDPLGEPPPTDLIPELRGESVKLNFKADAAIVDAINDHVDRLRKLSPYFGISNSDAIRSLIMEGSRAYQGKFQDEQPDKDDK